ncbi:MAG: preprotein translocase subunit SecG [Pseudomonadaceae bacterium]|nr:preprotein translocase subunit SecG [Pseudomonadaceae bacterium]
MTIETLESILLAALVADAIALAVLIMLQQGKGADVGAAFGSGASNTVFGSAGTGSALTRATTWLAIGFFAIAFGLAYTAKERAMSGPSLNLPDLPGIEAPSEVESSIPELTDDQEGVDSDLPDV